MKRKVAWLPVRLRSMPWPVLWMAVIVALLVALLVAFRAVLSADIKSIAVEKNFLDVQRTHQGVAIDIFSAPTWQGNVAGSPYQIGVWLTPERAYRHCTFAVNDFRLSHPDAGQVFHQDTVQTHVNDRRKRTYTSLRPAIALAESDHTIAFHVQSSNCPIDFHVNERLIYRRSERAITSWDMLMGI